MFPRILALLLASALVPGPLTRVDLDVDVPPGSPLDWGRSFPAITPPRKSLYPSSGERGEAAKRPETSSRSRSAEVDVRFSSSFGLVRILTWDLTGHLPWIGPQEALGPITGRRPFEVEEPRYGDALYWVTLAPLLRLMLHPDVVSQAETVAHLVEIGAPSLAVLDQAAVEQSLVEPAGALRRLIKTPSIERPSPLDADSPRERMLAQFVFDQLESQHPYDPEGTFGKELYLFHEEVEPFLARYASSPAEGLQRRAVSALARYDTRSADGVLFDAAFLSDDPVTAVRALAALGHVRVKHDWAPLVEHYLGHEEPALQVALLGALGRADAKDELPELLALGQEALEERDTDTLLALLTSLAQMSLGQLSPRSRQEEVLAFVEKLEEATHQAPRKFQPPGVRSNHKADQADAPAARAQVLRQLALLIRIRISPGDSALVERLLALSRTNPQQIRQRGQLGNARLALGVIHPPVQLLFLDALSSVGARGTPFLLAVAETHGIDETLRGHALQNLPYLERIELARKLAANVEVKNEVRIQALEVLLHDRDEQADVLCRALLAECAAMPAGSGSSAQRFLYLRALRALGERGKVTAADLLPLLFHVKAARHAFDELPSEVRELVQTLVSMAAQDASASTLRPGIEEVLDLLIRHEMNPRVVQETRKDARKFVEDQLSGVKAHRSDPGYLRKISETILEGLLGYGSPSVDPRLAEFAPEILLEQEIVLALGRTRSPQAAEVLVQLLGNRRNTNRAAACLALGMTGQAGFARNLASYLLDEDAFTRLCAYDSLRRLTGKDVAIDWMYGSSEERFRGAEEYLKWFLDQGR